MALALEREGLEGYLGRPLVCIRELLAWVLGIFLEVFHPLVSRSVYNTKSEICKHIGAEPSSLPACDTIWEGAFTLTLFHSHFLAFPEYQATLSCKPHANR